MLVLQVLLEETDHVAQSPEIVQEVLLIYLATILKGCLLQGVDLGHVEAPLILDSSYLFGCELTHINKYKYKTTYPVINSNR